jgi:hypothetical protein
MVINKLFAGWDINAAYLSIRKIRIMNKMEKHEQHLAKCQLASWHNSTKTTFRIQFDIAFLTSITIFMKKVENVHLKMGIEVRKAISNWILKVVFAELCCYAEWHFADHCSCWLTQFSLLCSVFLYCMSFFFNCRIAETIINTKVNTKRYILSNSRPSSW